MQMEECCRAAMLGHGPRVVTGGGGGGGGMMGPAGGLPPPPPHGLQVCSGGMAMCSEWDVESDIREHIQQCACTCNHMGYGNYMDYQTTCMSELPDVAPPLELLRSHNGSIRCNGRAGQCGGSQIAADSASSCSSKGDSSADGKPGAKERLLKRAAVASRSRGAVVDVPRRTNKKKLSKNIAKRKKRNS